MTFVTNDMTNGIRCGIQHRGTKGFDFAQTASGGVSLCEIDSRTMQSKKQKGLYFCGEALDLDGDCGGYNLTAAFLTGMLAGESV